MSHRFGTSPWSFPKLTRDEAVRDFPIAGVVPGWYLRVEQIAPGIHRIHGTDLCGNTFARFGPDERSLLADVAAAASAWKAEAARRSRWIWIGLLAWGAVIAVFAFARASAVLFVPAAAAFIFAWLVAIARDMAHRARKAAWLGGDEGPTATSPAQPASPPSPSRGSPRSPS